MTVSMIKWTWKNDYLPIYHWTDVKWRKQIKQKIISVVGKVFFAATALIDVCIKVFSAFSGSFQLTSQNVTKRHEMWRNVTKRDETSWNVTKSDETCQNIMKCDETSWNVTKRHETWQNIMKCDEASRNVTKRDETSERCRNHYTICQKEIECDETCYWLHSMPRQWMLALSEYCILTSPWSYTVLLLCNGWMAYMRAS